MKKIVTLWWCSCQRRNFICVVIKQCRLWFRLFCGWYCNVGWCSQIFSDVDSRFLILIAMGAECYSLWPIDPRGIKTSYAMDWSKSTSIISMAACLAAIIEATVGLPGCCDLGPRPIDLHLKAFEAMGAKMTMDSSCWFIPQEVSSWKTLAFIPGYGQRMICLSWCCWLLSRPKVGLLLKNAAQGQESHSLRSLEDNIGLCPWAGNWYYYDEGVPHLHGTRYVCNSWPYRGRNLPHPCLSYWSGNSRL